MNGRPGLDSFGTSSHASVPPLIRRPATEQCCSVFEQDSYGLATEQFRLMRRRLVNKRPDGGSVLLTSPGAGDGKSLNAHNLAWSLAEAGHSTLLLEMDLRRPVQCRYFRVESAPATSTVLNGELPAEQAIRHVEPVPLYFLGQDRPVTNASVLIRSSAVAHLLDWARQRFKWVVIDAPPILPVADVEELIPAMDLVLLVVRERVTPRAMVSRAAERLGKRLDYVVFNDVVLSDAYGYGYHY